jgi:hypothetical protein
MSTHIWGGEAREIDDQRIQMKDSEQRAKDLIAALETAANEWLEDFSPDVGPEWEQTTATLFAKIRSIRAKTAKQATDASLKC